MICRCEKQREIYMVQYSFQRYRALKTGYSTMQKLTKSSSTNQHRHCKVHPDVFIVNENNICSSITFTSVYLL